MARKALCKGFSKKVFGIGGHGMLVMFDVTNSRLEAIRDLNIVNLREHKKEQMRQLEEAA